MSAYTISPATSERKPSFMRDFKACTVSGIAGLLLGLAYAINYAEAYRDDLVDKWIGTRSIMANVTLGKACPKAVVCMKGPKALVAGVTIIGNDDDRAGLYVEMEPPHAE